jgi:hypothetical protein
MLDGMKSVSHHDHMHDLCKYSQHHALAKILMPLHCEFTGTRTVASNLL